MGRYDIVYLLAFLVVVYYAYKKGLLDQIFNLGSVPGADAGGGNTTGNALFAAVGDIDDNSATAQNIANSGAPVVIGLGDYSYGADPQEWYDTTMAAASNLTWYGTEGNHDNGTFADIFSGNQGTFDLTVQLGPVLLISVNTESVDEGFIQTSIDNGQNDPSVKLIIPFMHIPVRTLPSHHSAENNNLHNIFTAASKVKMVLQAHNHNMQVFVEDGITYVEAGSGGRDKYSVNSSGDALFVNDQADGILVAVDGGSQLNCSFIENGGSNLFSFSVPYVTTSGTTQTDTQEE